MVVHDREKMTVRYGRCDFLASVLPCVFLSVFVIIGHTIALSYCVFLIHRDFLGPGINYLGLVPSNAIGSFFGSVFVPVVDLLQ